MNRAIIVEEGLLAGLQESINILKADWKREGADDVFVLSHPKGAGLNPTVIKGILQSIPSLEGAFLIGELPVPRMSFEGGWYASDYFFMELQGNWSVDDQNYVSCQSYLPPTIFVGRLLVGEATGEVLGTEKPTILEFYKQYLEKLHTFRFEASTHYLRIDGTSIPIFPRARTPQQARNGFKAVVVNNWWGDTAIVVGWLEHLFPRENISTYEDVNKSEYSIVLENNSFDYMAFSCHSDPLEHLLADGTVWNAGDYLAVDSNVNFFELAACMSGSLVWEDLSDPLSPRVLRLSSDLLAWNILLAKKGGLLVFAPSNSRGMDYTTVFYDNLREGGTFGRAFRLWATWHINSFGDPASWAFIMFYGDPFVRFDVPNYDCVIITGIIGTALESKLYAMRLWRDKVFRANAFGRYAVNFYYYISPYLSKITMMSKLIRSADRKIISLALKILETTPLNAVVKSYMVVKRPVKPRVPEQHMRECKLCKRAAKAR